MRACVQRVSRAQVSVDGEVIGKIDCGLLVLLGVGKNDNEADAEMMAAKITGLRIFPDDDGKMNRSLIDCRGGMLVISQFTLYGDCRKGRRPSFISAADPADGERLYEAFFVAVSKLGVPTEAGQFGADMQVELTNDGPVTMLLDSERLF